MSNIDTRVLDIQDTGHDLLLLPNVPRYFYHRKYGTPKNLTWGCVVTPLFCLNIGKKALYVVPSQYLIQLYNSAIYQIWLHMFQQLIYIEMSSFTENENLRLIMWVQKFRVITLSFMMTQHICLCFLLQQQCIIPILSSNFLPEHSLQV